MQGVTNSQAEGMAETVAAILEERMKAMVANFPKQMMPMMPAESDTEDDTRWK